MRVFVLANSREEFVDWCVLMGVNPAACICVTDHTELRGKMDQKDQLFDIRAKAQREQRVA